MVELLNRAKIKADVRTLLQTAQVSPKGMTALYMGITMLLNVLIFFAGGAGLFSTFLSIFARLMAIILDAGFVLYCMGIRQNERMEYLELFDGFSFAGKLIVLYLVRTAYIFLWSCLFVIPGFIAYYRYRFAVYNLCENPEMSVMDALQLSARQTRGYKMQLFNLDMSYLGWAILSMLPVIFAEVYVFSTVMSLEAYMAVPASLAEVVVQGLWSLIVGLFYYPHYVCADLAYFEAAKGTSQPHTSPDGLGGF